MWTAADWAGPAGRRFALLLMETAAESRAVSHPPQSQTWSPAWSRWGPLCSWWFWTEKTQQHLHGRFLLHKLTVWLWTKQLTVGGKFSCAYSCLISWIFSWQSSSSGWSWARCLASCSLAVCRRGKTWRRLYEHRYKDVEEKLWDKSSCKTIAAKGLVEFNRGE